MSRIKVYWLCQTLGWTLYQGIGLTFAAAFMRVDAKTVASYVCTIPIAIGASHLNRYFIRRMTWLRLDWLSRIPRLIGSVVFTAVLAAIGAATIGLTLIGYRSAEVQVAPFVMSWMVAMLFWTILYVAFHDVENYRRAEREKLELQIVAKDAEIRSLLSQVNPHFLFNWLNNLRGMISEDPQRAQDIVTRFADLMRYSLQSSRRREVLLREEVEAVENYLACEKMRFDERLEIEWAIAPDALDTAIPPMILQTLVENGVKHGISQLPSGGLLRVSAETRPDTLIIRIQSSGQWVERNGNGTGTGIANARARLALIYGADSRLTVGAGNSGTVLAELVIPRNGGSTP